MATRPTSKKTTTNKKTPTKRSASTSRSKSTVQPKAKTRSSPGSSRQSSPTKANPTRKAQPTLPHRNPISPERRVEIAGFALLVVGLLSLLSLMTSQSGTLTSWWVATLRDWLGWGAYALPIVLLLLGAWFLLARMENFPKVSTERLIGVALFFLNILAWFQFVSSGTQTATDLQGGGRLGGSIFNALVRGLGGPGTVIVLVAWLLVALVLLVDLSVSDVVAWLAEKLKHSRSRFGAYIRAKAEESRLKRTALEDEPGGQYTLPNEATGPTFQPIPAPQATPAASEPSSGQRAWVLPEPEAMLNPVEAVPHDEESDQDRARVIEETLRSFNAPAHVVEIRRGPTITMFGVEPDFVESRSGKTRVRVNNITRLSDDLAMALKASRIRIQAPVPGKGYVGVEVPNQKSQIVALLELIESNSFRKHKSLMKFPLGKDVAGQPFTADLASMPHLLIAGTTGSGKSVCVNAILAGYLLTLTPDQLRMVMVDPKRVELTGYNGIPHLLTPVITDAQKVIAALQRMLREMDLRYKMFSNSGVRNIDEYNTQMRASGGQPLAYILVVIDELADLMMLAPAETERALTRLAQLARATGIHLILATQRPSTDVLTGLIKANFPARIAFAVASGVDSRVILDQPGAERLLSRGDMLFQAPDAPAPVRLQGTFVSDAEINNLTDFWREQAAGPDAPERPDLMVISNQPHAPLKDPFWGEEAETDPDSDPLEKEAILLIRKEGRASVSMLQRRMRIGYTRSARLIENLEKDGIIGPPGPAGTREVLDWGDFPPLNED